MKNHHTDSPSGEKRMVVPARRDTLRRLLARSRFQESLSLSPNRAVRVSTIAGLQAALAVLLAITLVRYSQWPELVGFPALGALAALFGRSAPLFQRQGIVWVCAGLLTAAVFATSLVSYLSGSAVLLVSVVAAVAGISAMVFSWWNLGAPGGVIIVFAAGAAMTPVDSWQLVLERTIATGVGGAVAWFVTSATDFLRLPELAKMPEAVFNRRPARHVVIAGLRIGIGAAAAAFIAHAAGFAHPSWAAIGATAVMQGSHLHVTMHRALQRMAGTLVGSLLVWLILSAEPPFWVVVVAIVFFQFITEVIIGFNYALGQITVTPMALLMTYLAIPHASAAPMAIERVFDTMLGAILGIIFAVIFSTVDDRRHLARFHREQNVKRRSLK